MNQATRKLTTTLLFCFLTVTGFSTSAVAAVDSESVDRATSNAETHRNVLVFGKFRLMKNGDETKFGDGIFSNTAAITLFRVDDQEEFTLRVGKDGQFSRSLTPGEYHVLAVEFKHQGKRIEVGTGYVLTVQSSHMANYVGTMSLKLHFDRGYNYKDETAALDRFIVENECSTECDSQLAQLGLDSSASTTALPQWRRHVAYAP